MSKLKIGINDLVTTHPELAEEWDYENNKGLRTRGGADISTPDKVMAGSPQRASWKCRICGHEWKSTVFDRVKKGRECPECTKEKCVPIGKDLQSLNPQLALEWNYERNKGLKNGNGRDVSTPDKVERCSTQKVWWKCKHGHEWEAKIESRTKGSGCPYCAGNLPIIGETDLETTHPEIAAQWHPTLNGDLRPTGVMAGSIKKVWWQCEKGHEWEAGISSRRKNGCPVCSNRKVVVGENDLRTTHPHLANEWHPALNGNLKPTDVTASSTKKVWWICPTCGYEWDTAIRNRAILKHGCLCCTGRKIVEGINDLATTHPELAKQWHFTRNEELTPQMVISGSHGKVWWKCPVCNHEWQAVIANRTNLGNGCPVCAGQEISAGKNDLQTLFPEIAAQWHPTKNIGLRDRKGRDISNPNKVSVRSGQKVWWQCSLCGCAWKTAVSKRTEGKGCPHCNESKGEKAIRKILTDKNISFEEQYKFKDRFGLTGKRLLKDDFAIFDKNGNIIGTIEYHGEQHYHPVDFTGSGEKWAKKEFEKNQKRDKLKSDYLAVHNIPQLIIPYWDFNNVETLITNFIKIIY